MTEREAFEGWVREVAQLSPLDWMETSQCYFDTYIDAAWMAWQASAARYEAVVGAAREVERQYSATPAGSIGKLRQALAALEEGK